MSLQLRLPLNGNLDNFGLTQSTIINNGAVIDSSGRIGKCYSFDGSNDYISVSDLYNNFKGGANAFSIGFWLYHTGNARRGVIFGNYGLLSSNRLNIEITASNYLRFWWDGAPDWSITTFTVTTQTWMHIVFVYTGSEIKVYKDGELKATRAGALTAKSPNSVYQIGRDSRTGATALYGKINEFKVWNHALSAKEILEDYNKTCLLCHYEFSDPYLYVQNNIITDITVNNARVEKTETGIKVLATSGDAYCGFTLSQQLISGTKYVLSYWGEIADGDTCQFGFYYSSRVNHVNTVKNGLNVVIFTPTTTLSSVTFDDSARSNSNPIYISNIKIEPYNASIGDHPTPYGSKINTVYDCARDYNGTINNQVLVLPVNKKYSYCTKFTGTQYMVGNRAFDIMPKAFSFWVQVDAKPSANEVIFADGKSKLAFGFYTNGTKVISGAGLSRYVQNLDNNFIFGAGKWNHVVVQANELSTNIEVYVNGTKLTNTSATNNWTHSVTTLYIGARNNGSVTTFGKFSIQDFRVYDTMLTEQDIYEMIHVPINLDNKGTLFNSEINEMDYNEKVVMNQYGQILSNKITEETLSGKQASILKTGEIKVNQLIEK